MILTAIGTFLAEIATVDPELKVSMQFSVQEKDNQQLY